MMHFHALGRLGDDEAEEKKDIRCTKLQVDSDHGLDAPGDQGVATAAEDHLTTRKIARHNRGDLIVGLLRLSEVEEVRVYQRIYQPEFPGKCRAGGANDLLPLRGDIRRAKWHQLANLFSAAITLRMIAATGT